MDLGTVFHSRAAGLGASRAATPETTLRSNSPHIAERSTWRLREDLGAEDVDQDGPDEPAEQRPQGADDEVRALAPRLWPIPPATLMRTTTARSACAVALGSASTTPRRCLVFRRAAPTTQFSRRYAYSCKSMPCRRLRRLPQKKKIGQKQPTVADSLKSRNQRWMDFFAEHNGVVAPLWLRAKSAYGGGRGMFEP